MKKQIIGLILLLFLIAMNGCNHRIRKDAGELLAQKPKITRYIYQLWPDNKERKELLDSVVFCVDTIYYGDRNGIMYSPSIECNSIHSYTYAFNKDSLFWRDMYCENLDTIQIKHKNQTIELFRSLFDIPGSIDEECDIYWNNRYGIVALHHFPWNTLVVFEKEEVDRFAKEKLYEYVLNLTWEVNEPPDGPKGFHK